LQLAINAMSKRKIHSLGKNAYLPLVKPKRLLARIQFEIVPECWVRKATQCCGDVIGYDSFG
jgi:hypothetical protein